MSRSKQKKNREDNPAKYALERRGIKFPQQSSQDCRAATEEVTNPSSILNTAPTDEKEEVEHLAIVMHEAANSTAAFPCFENDRCSCCPVGPVLGYPTPCYPFHNCEMARMNHAQSLYEPRPIDTCTLTTIPYKHQSSLYWFLHRNHKQSLQQKKRPISC